MSRYIERVARRADEEAQSTPTLVAVSAPSLHLRGPSRFTRSNVAVHSRRAESALNYRIAMLHRTHDVVKPELAGFADQAAPVLECHWSESGIPFWQSGAVARTIHRSWFGLRA
jgi:hypothetical protein